MKTNSTRIILAAAALALSSACSFSTSSKSISDSISGSSESISGSSTSSSPDDDKKKSADGEALYREDVRTFTAAWVRDGGDPASFQRGLGSIARQHGISDWEAVPSTWTGIGEGLRSAAATAEQRDAVTSELAGDDADKRRDIARGYAGQA